MLTIKSVVTKKEQKEFIQFPWKIYAGNSAWVPPLKMDMKQKFNPKFSFYEIGDMECFIAYQNGEAVGRIAAIENRLYNEIHQDKTGFFGFFECINDQTVANFLFDTAKSVLQKRGLNIMHGPASPSSNHDYGLLVDAFDDAPRLMMSYNPPYYQQLIENYGFKVTQKLYAYKLEREKLLTNEKLTRGAKLVTEKYGITFRPINLKKIDQEIALIKEIWNKGWEKNYGFCPLTDKELDELAEALKPLADEQLVLFGEIQGKTVGIGLAVWDYNAIIKDFNGNLFPFNILKLLCPNKKKFEWVRVVMLGILPEYRGKGLDTAFYYNLIMNALKNPYMKYAEASWILESNAMMNRGMKIVNGEIYKTYLVYECEV
ncbi:MAG: hypothetical protein ACKVTZ_06520 [Bacteroidia bacterium]